MCYEEFIPGKVYKALCACSLKVKKGTSTHKGLERPWYSPARHAIIATDTYMAIEVDFKTTECHPCTFGGDDDRVLAKDRVAFYLPMEFEPVNPSNWRNLIDKPTQARGNSYDPKLLDKVLKVAKAGGWDLIIDSAPDEVMRGRFMSSNHEELGRFILMPKQGIY